MIKTRNTVVALALAMAVLPLATATALAADDGPIVNDYSKMGADYDASSKESESDKAGSDAMNSDQASESGSSSSQASADSGEEGKPYKVQCSGSGPCKASKDVITGYEEYGGHCLRCHGETAEGSVFAPSLVQRLKGMGQGRFTAAVAGGVTKLDTTTGQYRVMPAWSGNEEVMSHLQELWAFLKARSDGALNRQRPEPMGGEG